MLIIALIDAEAGHDGPSNSEMETHVKGVLASTSVDAIVVSNSHRLFVLIDQLPKGPVDPLAIVRGCEGIRAAHVTQAIVRVPQLLEQS